MGKGNKVRKREVKKPNQDKDELMVRVTVTRTFF